MYGLQYINRKLLITRFRRSHCITSQHIQGVLESVVNCIPDLIPDLTKDKVIKIKQKESYGVKHINGKLLSSRIQLSHCYASQRIEGALELVVNCIP